MYRNIILFLIIATVASAAPLFKNGHSHPVTLLIQKDNILFSGDASGILKAWNEKGDLLANFQISDMPINLLDFSKEDGLLVVLSGEPGQTSYMSVWSWNLQSKLYTHTLEHPPLNISISPEGRFIVYTVFGMDSVHVIYSMSGKESDMMPNPISLASDFLISSNEQRMMAYSANSGTLTYYILRNGEKIQSSSTLKNIRKLRVLPGKRYAIGLHRNNLVTIDILNGSTIDTYSHPDHNIEDYALNNNKAALLLRSNQTARYSLQTLRVQSGQMSKENLIALSQNTWKKIALWNNTNSIVSDATGTLHRIDAYGRSTLFADYKSVAIQSFYLDTNSITIASKEYVYTFYASVSEILAALWQKSKQQLVYEPRNRHITDPYNQIYNNSQSIVLQNIPETLLDTILMENIQDIRLTQLVDHYLLILSGMNTLFLYDLQTQRKVLEYISVGIETALYIPGNGIFIGTSSDSSPLGESLYLLNTESTETIPVPTPLFFVHNMVYDEQDNILWVIGLQKHKDTVRTVLEGRSGKNFEYRWVEEYFLLESLDTRLALDTHDNSLIFFSSDSNFVKAVPPPRRAYQVDADSFLQSVQIHDSYLVAINSDKALEIQDSSNGSIVLTFYLLPEGEWLVFSDQQYLSSLGLQDSANYFNSNTKLNDQRLNVQVRQISQAAEQRLY